MSYEFLEHTADVKFKAESTSWEKMFSDAAGALNETIRGDIKILELDEKSFEVEGRDLEILLHNFYFYVSTQSLTIIHLKKESFQHMEVSV